MVHYENFRATKLSQLMSGNAKSTTSPLHQLDVERREHKNKMKRMEAEMEQVFELKVKEKISRLNDSEIGKSSARITILYVNFRASTAPRATEKEAGSGIRRDRLEAARFRKRKS